MSQIGDLRAALANNMRGLVGVSVSPYARKQPNAPGIHLWPSEIPAYHRTFGTPPVLSEIVFMLEAFVSYTVDIGAQQIMDELLSPEGARSVALAIESDPTLGGLAQDVECESSTAYTPIVTADNREMLTAVWTVRVLLL